MRFSRPFTARTQTSVAALALAALSLAGCGTAATSSTTTSSSTETTTTTTDVTASETDATAVVDAATVTEDTHYDADDLTWDAAEEVAVTVADGASSSEGDGVTVDGDTVTISAAGTYRLSGSLTDGQVIVAAGEEDVVRVILDGVELSNSAGSPFVVTSANEALVYLADGTMNTLSDAEAYTDTSTDAPNAALYSMADLTIAGGGSLTVNGNSNNGITSKDGLVLASGNVTVTAVDDGIEGKDYLAVLGGIYNVSAGGDGVKATNEEDDSRGWFTVYGGELVVSSGDDGIKAATLLTVNAGTVTVTDSVEGVEAQHIAINGGSVNVTASDDGVNASGGSSATSTSTAMGGGPGGGSMEAGNYTVSVTGGQLTINSEGDGLDCNGNASLTGGTVVVNGPSGDGNGALDVNGELAVDGGVLAAAGSAGMAVAPGESSTQAGVQLTFGSSVPAGSVIHLADLDGNIVASFAVAKAAASLVFSSDAIVDGETYTVYVGENSTDAAGLFEGSLDGAEEAGTVVAGEYTQGHGPGF